MDINKHENQDFENNDEQIWNPKITILKSQNHDVWNLKITILKTIVFRFENHDFEISKLILKFENWYSQIWKYQFSKTIFSK